MYVFILSTNVFFWEELILILILNNMMTLKKVINDSNLLFSP